MNKLNLFLLMALFSLGMITSESVSGQSNSTSRPEYVLVIHGGAGVLESAPADIQAKYHNGLREALLAGEAVLKSGGSAIDAIVAAITKMEDNPLFNAGKGAVYNEAGEITMDASIMEGKEGRAGAVGLVKHTKNPILAAKAIMDDGRHVFLVGEGAEIFAQKAGVEMVEQDYFYTQPRWDAYEHTLKTKLEREFHLNSKGTVGAAALDKHGNLAAGTSTGGMHFKRVGRLGDSPVIGAGTWADNQSCAVSATGHGEYFIRNNVASDISARMKYLGETLQKAADYVIMDKLMKIEAEGGIIAVDKDGNIAMPFNTTGMYRGYVKAGEKPVTKIYIGE
ncbi:MAG: isoaspartyl peptidase/L-asparaginase [Saprospiraceae bacterium]|nr:isoaspartyl peptidase/L-asparaginase [Saprospiraceae bacterium]MCZ2338811.1 isoaspartyl peptidase/L-asparaginase [Chitinophagales bacterium]